MKLNFISELLATDDALIEERIADEFAPQMDTERLFQRSMAKYHGFNIESAKTKPIWKRSVFRIAVSAACLLLTAGLVQRIWSKQQRIEPKPPQETGTVMQTTDTVMQTESGTETTALPSTEAQTSCQTETSVRTTENVQTEQPVIVPETTIPTTTAPVQTTVQTAATTVPLNVIQTIPTTGSVQTAPMHKEIKSPYTTESAVIMTESQTMPATEPATVPQTEPETVSVTLTGFRVEQYPDCQKIICTDEFPVPDGELASYLMLSDEFTVLSMSEPEMPEPERSYEIECAEAGKVFTVTQREYAEFALTVEEGELIDIGLNRAHGFFHLQGEVCSLYWFRDGEGFFVSGDASELKYLMAIARSFTPAGESK